MASAEHIAKWRARLRRANAGLIRPLTTKLRRELEVCADEVIAARWNGGFHHVFRVEKLLTDEYVAAVRRFAPLAVEMLAETPIDGQHRAEQSMERARARELLEKIQTRDGESVLFSDRVAELVRGIAPTRARAIGARTNRIVSAALQEAAAAGMGEAEAGRLIRQRVATDRLSVSRARTIARTEIGAAQNGGLLASADELGVQYHRIWITIQDGRERLSHGLADEQTIGPGEKFQVGDAQLEHPGDPSGPPQEIINCRCTMLLEAV